MNHDSWMIQWFMINDFWVMEFPSGTQTCLAEKSSNWTKNGGFSSRVGFPEMEMTWMWPYYPGWWLGHPSEKYEFVNWDD